MFCKRIVTNKFAEFFAIAQEFSIIDAPNIQYRVFRTALLILLHSLTLHLEDLLNS